jgi:hypothetical protein
MNLNPQLSGDSEVDDVGKANGARNEAVTNPISG